MDNILKIVGLKVLTIRGFRTDRRKKNIRPKFILFNDNKTYIVLEDQDYYTYHDFNGRAKVLEVYSSKKEWNKIYNDLAYYPKATEELI